MPLTTVMDHVARLEARGHARRTADPRDRRQTQIVLTATSFADTLAVDKETATRWLAVIRDAVEETAARQTEPSATRRSAASVAKAASRSSREAKMMSRSPVGRRTRITGSVLESPRSSPGPALVNAE